MIELADGAYRVTVCHGVFRYNIGKKMRNKKIRIAGTVTVAETEAQSKHDGIVALSVR
jgi:hypothetical protein